MEQLKHLKGIICLTILILLFSCANRQNLDDELSREIKEAKITNEMIIYNNNRFNDIPESIFKLKNIEILSFIGSECDIKPSCINITKVPSGYTNLASS